LAKKKTQSKEDFYSAVNVARQKLFKYYAQVTPKTSQLLISAHMLEPFRKLHPFRKWDKAININPEGESSYNTQHQEAFLKYVENEYFAKHRPMSVIIAEHVPRSNIFHSGKASGFGQSSVDLDDLSSSDEEYITPKSVTETTPGQSDPAARLLTAARLYFDSPPELPNT